MDENLKNCMQSHQKGEDLRVYPPHICALKGISNPFVQDLIQGLALPS